MSNRDRGDDEGVTLVELVIYISFSVVIASIVMFMFINTFRGQENVTSVTEATTRGQVAAQGIERAVRNSTDFEISADGSTLTVATTLAAKCQGWRFVGDVLEISTTAGFAEGSWRPFVDNIRREADPADEPPFFSEESTRLLYRFDVTTDNRPVTFAGQTLPRASGDSVSASCS